MKTFPTDDFEHFLAIMANSFIQTTHGNLSQFVFQDAMAYGLCSAVFGNTRYKMAPTYGQH